MFKILTILTYLSTATAIFIWGVSGVMIGIRKAGATEENLKNINAQLSVCRRAALFFMFLCWLVASGKPWSECVGFYREISDVCLRIAAIWFISAFANVIFSALTGLFQGKNGPLFNYMTKARLSGFLYGTIFLTISYFLHLA